MRSTILGAEPGPRDVARTKKKAGLSTGLAVWARGPDDQKLWRTPRASELAFMALPLAAVAPK